ncbi:MAG: aminodeoxychorismate/anthranilate synthase component II [Gammaproteobacteria bacterium]|nr:aminodeoxychorismate/anthranilate synthase component II [Gammaproteobacteria bacterium]
MILKHNVIQTKHVLLIDHYDSFTQLIKAYFEQLGARVSVVQSDALALQKIEVLAPTHVVLSPGPGCPKAAPETQAFILEYYQKYPILGVCLGLQCLIEAFGGRVLEASDICHGKQVQISHLNEGLFQGIKVPFIGTRYHSLVASFEHLPKDWHVAAWTYDTGGCRVIMGIQHQKYPLFGVQYHPEAILTEQGIKVFENFLLI